MSEMVLSGLKSNVPLGAMAAFGLFRIANRIQLGDVRLHWKLNGSGWCAVLTSNQELTEDELIAHLLIYLKSQTNRPEFDWNWQIKSATKEKYTVAATDAIKKAEADDHDLADWFNSFGNELIVTEEEGVLDPTPFDMTVAKQRFLADNAILAKELAEDEKGEARLREALFGPWKYQDEQHSLGWDPSTVLLGAFTFKKPETMKKWGVRAAIWLATESLPLFPCFCVASGLGTRGFRSVRRMQEFCWAVWEQPISLPVLKSLLASSELTDPKKIATLRSRGVSGVYRSRKFKPNKYMVSFQPAQFFL